MRFKDVLVITALLVTWIEVAPAQDDQTQEGYYRTPLLIRLVGRETTVWFNDGEAPIPIGNQCKWHDTPDQPATAIRDHLGRVQIFGGGFDGSYKLVGTNFSVNPAVPGHLSRKCHSIFTAGFMLPGGWVYENFRNHDWISGLIVDEETGRNIYGLLQAEFWGAQSPHWGSFCSANCPPGAGIVSPCWVNAVTAARSTDGGDQFLRGGFDYEPKWESYKNQDSQVIAKIMDTYVPCEGRTGFLSPTDIVRYRDPKTEAILFRAMVEADATESKELSQQASGMVVLQCGGMTYDHSIVPDGKWRAFGGHGQGFNRNLAHGDIATVVGEPELGGLRIKSLFYLHDLKTYIGLGSQTDTGGTGNVSIYYALSKDLIKWESKTKLLDSGSPPTMQGVTLYPSFINHGAHSHNLNQGSASNTDIHLYMVRRLSNATVSQVHRKLSRIPIKIQILE